MDPLAEDQQLNHGGTRISSQAAVCRPVPFTVEAGKVGGLETCLWGDWRGLHGGWPGVREAWGTGKTLSPQPCPLCRQPANATLTEEPALGAAHVDTLWTEMQTPRLPAELALARGSFGGTAWAEASSRLCRMCEAWSTLSGLLGPRPSPRPWSARTHPTLILTSGCSPGLAVLTTSVPSSQASSPLPQMCPLKLQHAPRPPSGLASSPQSRFPRRWVVHALLSCDAERCVWVSVPTRARAGPDSSRLLPSPCPFLS